MMTRGTQKFYDPEDPQPGFYDVYANSDLPWTKRLARRLLITGNYERSIRLHKALGTRLVGALVMNTVGRLRKETYNSNYHLGEEGSPLDRAAKYAFKGSVFNEVVHGAFGYPAAIVATADWIENGPNFSPSLVSAVMNLGLVALQRYNRARMIQYIDHALREGRGFSPEYQSWTDVDASSLATARAEMRADRQDDSLPPNFQYHPPTN